MNTKLKRAIQIKARADGLTLSDVLNFAARAYIDGNMQIRMVDKDTAEALDDIAHGRVMSQEALFKKLRL